MATVRCLRWGMAALVVAAMSAPKAADACGGTFCDSGPTAMPVDQTGENILFVLDGQSVEAHVQIQYSGSPDRFAWVVPMPEIPTVEVGSQLLFTSLLQATVPSYGYFRQFDTCGQLGGFGGSAGTSAGSGGAAGTGGTGGAGGPTVVFKKVVGAFEVTVLQGGTAQEVSDWLLANGYQTIPSAPVILQDYVAQNFVFVAVKLVGGAGVDEIHPLVFRYAGNEPCVPLKLTAVAAVEDMGVRAFFLGDDRVYPSPGYMHLELNPVRIDWTSFGSNYAQVVARAADSATANGRAFVTEYAGASSAVSVFGVWSATWSEAPFATAAPETVVTTLQSQGLLSCNFGDCSYNHPLLLPLLQQYLPAPTGVAEGVFYSDLASYRTLIDRQAWDAAAFTADFKARIVDPARHARDLLTRWPFLTRLFTTISPSEMTLDPTFHARPDLSNAQVNGQQFATLRTTCSGQTAMLLPDAREVAGAGSSWPLFSSLMPWVEKIEEVPLSGAVVTLVDNTNVINEQLAAWNASQGWPPAGTGGTGAVGTGATGGLGGAAASGGVPASATDNTTPSGGCGCATPATGGGYAGLALLLAGLGTGVLRRKRR